MLIGLAANPATTKDHWPWHLDVIRRHPFPAVALFRAAAVVLAWVVPQVQRRAAPMAAVASASMSTCRIRSRTTRTMSASSEERSDASRSRSSGWDRAIAGSPFGNVKPSL
jgi:hypothetical protein